MRELLSAGSAPLHRRLFTLSLLRSFRKQFFKMPKTKPTPSKADTPHARRSDGATRRPLEFVICNLGFIWDLGFRDLGFTRRALAIRAQTRFRRAAFL